MAPDDQKKLANLQIAGGEIVIGSDGYPEVILQEGAADRLPDVQKTIDVINRQIRQQFDFADSTGSIFHFNPDWVSDPYALHALNALACTISSKTRGQVSVVLICRPDMEELLLEMGEQNPGYSTGDS